MNKKFVLSLVPLLLLGVFLGVPSVIHLAHAAGTVCFNDPSSFTVTAPCAPAGFNLNGPAPDAPLTNAIPVGNLRGNTQIRVGVYLSGPDLINGFDITVLSNRTVLRPTSVDLTGTILALPTSTVVLCIDGNLVSGPTCLTTDVQGTIHFSVSGAPAALSTASTGLLFTAVYNVTGRTPVAGQIIRFQTGCGSPTSPTSNPPNCVTITNGGSGPVSESLGTVRFNNSVNPNWVAISTPSPTAYSFNFGSASPVVKFNATAENGFPGIIGSNTVSFTSTQTAGLTVSFTGALTSCGAGAPAAPTCCVSASFGASQGGTYFVTVFGNYQSSNDTDLTTHGTLAGTVSIIINIIDVAWTVNGVSEYNPTNTQTFYLGVGASQAIHLPFVVTSLGGFVGTITYSTAALTGTTGLVFTYPATFNLAAGQTVTNDIVGTATAMGQASYVPRITTTGSIATFHHSALLTVRVSGFTLTSNVTSVTFAPSGSKNVQLSSTSLGNPAATAGFAGPVTLTAPYTGPAGVVLVFTYKPGNTITLAQGGSGNANVTISGTTPGTYSVTFTGTGGTNNAMSTTTVVSVVISGGKNSPTIGTTLSATTITVGSTVSDSATLTGATTTAGGTVSYLLYLNGLCTAPSNTVSVVTVTNAVVPNSRAVQFNATGSFSFQARYSGDTGNNPATSPCEPLTVNKATTTTTLTSSANPSVFGQSVTFTATVTGSTTVVNPTGTVNFLDGAAVIGSCSLPVASPFTCTFSTAALSVATHSITATYVGDGNFNTSTSTAVSQVVNKANTTTTLTSSTNPSVFGQSVTFTATVVVATPGAGTPTGTVNFLDGATNIGSCSLPAAAPFTCTFSTGALSVATHSITATYVGNANFNTSTSTAVSQVVNKANTSASLTSSANPSVFGQSVTFTATVTVTAPGAGSPTGAVNFLDGATNIGSCTLPAAAPFSCTFR